MSGWDIFFLFLYVIMGVALGVDAYLESRREKQWVYGKDRPIYGQSTYVMLLSTLSLLSLKLVTSILVGSVGQLLFYSGFSIFIVGIYYGLLLVIRPLLRNRLRAGSFAILWSAPCFVFYILSHNREEYEGVLWTIQLPFSYPSERVRHVLVAVWATGVVTILLWSVVSHLMFRRWLLKWAVYAENNVAVESYARQKELLHSQCGNIPVLISSKVSTPLSIGLLWRTTCIVLPEREYSPEELDLIFRHELIHICRRDSQQKLFMTICTALMWFNPLMWLAMKCCAEDLELSCDDAVLYGYEQGVRRRYAGLLLQTAADQRGFTTCLAGSPGSLKYRLKEAVKPQKRVAGSVLVGVLSCLLIVGSTCVSVSFLPETERIFQKSDRESWVVSDVIVTDGKKDPYTKYYDADALYDYVASLELSLHTKKVDPMREYRHVQIVFRSGNHTVIVQIGGKLVRVNKMTFHNGERTHNEEVCYTMNEELDMEYILSCLHG